MSLPETQPTCANCALSCLVNRFTLFGRPFHQQFVQVPRRVRHIRILLNSLRATHEEPYRASAQRHRRRAGLVHRSMVRRSQSTRRASSTTRQSASTGPPRTWSTPTLTRTCARACGVEPVPGVGSCALRALPGRVGPPVPSDRSELLHRLFAGEAPAWPEVEGERLHDAQHVGLADPFQEVSQASAGAVDLVAADEVEGRAVPVCLAQQINLDSALGPGPTHPLGQPHRGPQGGIDELEGQPPQPVGDQRVSDSFDHIGEVGGRAHRSRGVTLNHSRGRPTRDCKKLWGPG